MRRNPPDDGRDTPPPPDDAGHAAPPDPDPEELARLTLALARKSQEMEVLQRVSSDINSTLDLDEIYDIALRTMDDLFEFHHANILLLEPGGQTLTVVASRGYENQAVGGRVNVGTGVIGLVAQRRRMLHVNNLGQQRAYAAAQRRQMVKAGRAAEIGEAASVPGLPNAESQIAIPLISRDELMGVFSIESPVQRTFSEHDRQLVAIVANQIASAIHNARLYEERRQAVDALQAANASLEARVAERTAALERELKVAGELLADARSRVEGPLVGESPAVRALRDDIVRAAGDATPLLLVGAPGVGKEAVAHAVHEASRRPGAFIYLGGPELHTEPRPAGGGPGTGGRPERALLAAKLELAAGGTLFVDAIDQMPVEFRQALRDLLDEEPGTSGPSPTPEVRLIGSATREFASHQDDGRPEPLYRVLSRNRILVPALADRSQDIPMLVDDYIRRQARRLGKMVDGVSTDSLRRLEAYPWPGNMRELRTVLERAILVSRGPVIEVDEDLLDERLAVGSYRLVSRLGAGGMGEIWLAKHRLLARPAAVKLIRHDTGSRAAHEDLVRRFQREAQVTSGLRSPHTVQLYDFGVNDTGSFYYVMELLEGFDLQHIVSRFGPLPWERVIMLIRQACRSLAEAHAHGLVHRDIKPANLFVTRLGSEYDYLKVLDFGIVKDEPGQEATILSARDILQGTPAFMAPERVLGERTIDGRSDLYSLACTAYLALTGEPVFPAETPGQMLLHHVQQDPPPLSAAAGRQVPAELETVLLECLEKDPASRPASALELDDRLARVPNPDPWTQQRAKAWWEANAPEIVAGQREAPRAER